MKSSHIAAFLERGFLGRKLVNEQSGKTTFLTIIFIIMALIVIAAIAVTLSLSSNGSSQVKIVVEYSGNWSGNYGSLGSQNNYNGTGPQSISVQQDVAQSDITVTFQKADEGTGTLTVSIEKMDGTVLATSSTSEVHGMVSVSWNNS